MAMTKATLIEALKEVDDDAEIRVAIGSSGSSQDVVDVTITDLPDMSSRRENRDSEGNLRSVGYESFTVVRLIALAEERVH